MADRINDVCSPLGWGGLTERIRAWQAVTFPGVTEEVGKWRTLNEIAELGKKIASGAPLAEIYEEAADVIITMQHERRPVEFLPYQRTRDYLHVRAAESARALLSGDVELAFMRATTIFPTEAAAYAEVERKFAIVQARKWKIAADKTGQHMSVAEVKLERLKEICAGLQKDYDHWRSYGGPIMEGEKRVAAQIELSDRFLAIINEDPTPKTENPSAPKEGQGS
jgi:hypothetical protein